MTTAEALDELPVAAAPSRRDELHRLWTLAWTLAITDWKLKFYGSALGALWTLVRPFAFFGVILFVFTEVAHIDSGNTPHYSVYILFAMVFFNFFAEVTNASVQSLVVREGLLRKMQFNPIVIPLAITITALLNLALTFAAVLIYVFASGVFPTWGWLELPVMIVLLTMLAMGAGMLLAALYVRYRDIQPIWEVVGQALFYASAVLFVVETAPAKYQHLLLGNPIAAIFTQMRHAVIDSDAQSLWTLAGWGAAVPLALIFLVFTLGLWFFLRESPRVAENL